MNIRTPQAVSSPTFNPPPIDGSLTLPEIYDLHLKSDHPIFVFKVEDDLLVKHINWTSACKAIHAAAHLVNSSKPPKRSVIAILAIADTPTYFALTAGIIRAGHQAFPISTRNSDVGVAYLLRRASVQYVFVSEDETMQGLVASAIAKLSEEKVDGRQPMMVKVVKMPTFGFLYGSIEATTDYLPPMDKPHLDDPALILHSSGSTKFPEPIYLTHRVLLQWARHPYFGETDVCGQILSVHALPSFHGMGVISSTWAASSGLILATFDPHNHPTVPSAEIVLVNALATRSDHIFSIPAFVEAWVHAEGSLESLAEFMTIIYGGAPIAHEVGQLLETRGIRAVSIYGATEFGAASVWNYKQAPCDAWEYIKFSPHCTPILIKNSDKDSLYQLMFKNTPLHTLSVISGEDNGEEYYDSKDLVIQHANDPELWKIYGRLDDQIIHSTGEKTNPGPMERIISAHPSVAAAIIFGSARFNTGVLVELVPGSRFDMMDASAAAAARESLWPAVEKANQVAPSHSRILKEMIIFASPSKPFQYAGKGTPRRHFILNEYAPEIEASYVSAEKSIQSSINLPTSWDIEECCFFVRNIVESVLKAGTITDDADLFSNGCDSLQAAYMRNILVHLLQQTSLRTNDIPLNVVYQFPTIRRLGRFLAQLVTSPDEPLHGTPNSVVAEMREMADKYSTSFPQVKGPLNGHAFRRRPYGDVVLLTGSTGALGAHILDVLIQDPSVTHIYALNRRHGFPVAVRQEKIFRELDVSIAHLRSEKVTLLEGDLEKEYLGLEQAVYEEINKSVTHIIHNAWRVDFNVALSSMEPLIQGTRRLIDIALTSPSATLPRLLFTSSIGVFTNWPIGVEASEVAIDKADVAAGSGYSKSKWVAETVLTRAAERTNLRPIIVRLGQICAGNNGYWNTSEWAPSIIRSGQVLGCLPRATGVLSWIPGNVAAKAIVEMRNSSDTFLHLVHPQPVGWDSVFEPISRILGIPLVPYSEWLTALEALSPSDGRTETVVAAMGRNPALRLLDFFRSVANLQLKEDEEAMGFPRLSVEHAKECVVWLKDVKQLEPADIEGWLNYFQRVGFLD